MKTRRSAQTLEEDAGGSGAAESLHDNSSITTRRSSRGKRKAVDESTETLPKESLPKPRKSPRTSGPLPSPDIARSPPPLTPAEIRPEPPAVNITTSKPLEPELHAPVSIPPEPPAVIVTASTPSVYKPHAPVNISSEPPSVNITASAPSEPEPHAPLSIPPEPHVAMETEAESIPEYDLNVSIKFDDEKPEEPEEQVKRRSLARSPVNAGQADVKTRKKRRSSFVPGRLSTLPGPADSSVTTSDVMTAQQLKLPNILADIPADLPPGVRLERANLAAILWAAEQVADEYSHLPGMDEFKAKAPEHFRKMNEGLKNAGIFDGVVAEPKNELNAVQSDHDILIAKHKSTKERLTHELNMWSGLVDSHKKLLDEVTELEKQGPHIIRDPPSSLTKEQLALLAAAPNLTQAMDHLKVTREKIVLAVDAVGRVVNLQQSVMSELDQALKDRTQDFYKKTFEGIPNFDSPADLLLQIQKDDFVE